MKAAVMYQSKDLRVEQKPEPSASKGQVKVAVAWGGICGSDLHAFHSGVETPLALGHEFAGIVSEVGEGVTKFSPGDRVAINPLLTTNQHDNPLYDMYKGFAFVGLNTDGGFADYVVVEEKNVVKLPEGMTLEQGALVEPTAVAAQAIRESGLQFGESVAVFGAGPIGLLTILVAKAAGAKEIFAFDLSETRLAKAKEVGATYAINSGTTDPVEFLKSHYPDGVDRTFEVAGVAPTFNQSIQVTRPRGVVTVVSIFEKPFEFSPMALTASGVRIASSLAYEPDIFDTTVQLIASGHLDPTQVITDRIELEDIVEKGFNSLLEDKSQAKILVKLSGKK